MFLISLFLKNSINNAFSNFEIEFFFGLLLLFIKLMKSKFNSSSLMFIRLLSFISFTFSRRLSLLLKRILPFISSIWILLILEFSSFSLWLIILVFTGITSLSIFVILLSLFGKFWFSSESSSSKLFKKAMNSLLHFHQVLDKIILD